MEFNELIAGFATRHNVTNLTAIDNAAASLRRARARWSAARRRSQSALPRETY